MMGIGYQRQSTYVPTVAPPAPTIGGGLTPVKLGDTYQYEPGGVEWESYGSLGTRKGGTVGKKEDEEGDFDR